MIRASDWKPVERNTLQGFCSLHLEPSGLVLHDCTLHRKGDREWIALPGKVQVDRAGTPRRDAATGKLLYSPVIEIPDRDRRERFQTAALAAVRKLLDEAAP